MTADWRPWIAVSVDLEGQVGLIVRAETATYPSGRRFLRCELEVTRPVRSPDDTGHPFFEVPEWHGSTCGGEIVRDRPLQRALIEALALDERAFRDAMSNNAVRPKIVALLHALWD